MLRRTRARQWRLALCALVGAAVAACGGAEPAAPDVGSAPTDATGVRAVGLGACTTDDRTKLDRYPQDPTSQTQLCFLQCEQDRTRGCAASCFQAVWGLGTGCQECFVDMLMCVYARCSATCRRDSDSRPCDVCVAERCDAAFETCSGTKVGTSIVVTVDGFSYCTAKPIDPELVTRAAHPFPARPCSGADDQRLVSRLYDSDTIQLCGEACFAKGPVPTAQCLIEKGGLSVDCALCLGQTLQDPARTGEECLAGSK